MLLVWRLPHPSYCKEVLDSLGLAHLRRLLPTILDGTREWHGLSAAAAVRTGLAQGLPVVLGYLDLACGALGAGAYGAGIEAGVSILGARYASASGSGSRPRSPERCDDRLLYAFPVPGYTLQMQTNMAASLNLDWLASLVQDAARLSDADANIETGEILHILDRAVMEAGPGAVLFHPFISSSGERGPFINPHTPARGFLALTKVCDCHSWRERVDDGLGLAARDCYIAMGGLPASVRITGGAAHSKSIRAIPSCLLELSRERRDTRRDRGGRGSDDRGCQRRSVSRYGCLRRALDRGRRGRDGASRPYPGSRLRPFVPGLPQGYETLPTVWRQLHAARAKIHGV